MDTPNWEPVELPSQIFRLYALAESLMINRALAGGELVQQRNARGDRPRCDWTVTRSRGDCGGRMEHDAMMLARVWGALLLMKFCLAALAAGEGKAEINKNNIVGNQGSCEGSGREVQLAAKSGLNTIKLLNKHKQNTNTHTHSCLTASRTQEHLVQRTTTHSTALAELGKVAQGRWDYAGQFCEFPTKQARTYHDIFVHTANRTNPFFEQGRLSAGN